jgi:2-keto-4-pentenoate hydratase/2-oxohepta-3-ene-1,7-dioic acid hydratase in catechol pathway
MAFGRSALVSFHSNVMPPFPGDIIATGTPGAVPLGADVPLAELGKQGWNVARGDLAPPITTPRADALEHNINARPGVLVEISALAVSVPREFHTGNSSEGT